MLEFSNTEDENEENMRHKRFQNLKDQTILETTYGGSESDDAIGYRLVMLRIEALGCSQKTGVGPAS